MKLNKALKVWWLFGGDEDDGDDEDGGETTGSWSTAGHTVTSDPRAADAQLLWSRDSPQRVAHHQERHVGDVGVLQDVVRSLLHQVSVGQDQLLPVELLLKSTSVSREPLARGSESR